MHHEQVKVIEIVLLDEKADDGTENPVEAGLGVEPAQKIGEAGSGVLDVLRGEGDEQGVLVREVLVERPHGDLSLVGDVVGGGSGIPLLMENASRCFEDSLDRATGTVLTWSLPG
jgi:hypothetical protein